MDLKKVIADIPDFPKPGILFRDITPILEDPRAYRAAVDGLAALLRGTPCDRLAAIESRGFILGGPLSLRLDRGLILVRKAGKLPRATVGESYDLEYGSAAIEVHRDSLKPGERVVVIDDLLATGGTAAAAGRLVRKCGGEVAAYLFMVELGGLGGRRQLADAPVFSLVVYD
ncbi:MAG TPA: adenine phosphoribosyltransferase [Candidatus Krumholzibacteria bacterium]|nr:adenine phosphoribosyltransferase [Candidatus Krumholzibacteria bacterium]HPD71537.1 adenine phosphoribosyltransferase [Candidatus Krumholzibacteria bacterium]HRY41530.1 adenine phosphoribosyltransferase [Candidatus Krumholzibacteria bacterium]